MKLIDSDDKSLNDFRGSLSRRMLNVAATLFESPWRSAVIAGVYYLALSILSGRAFSVTPNAYYNYLADAFLHGQYSLRLIPPSVHDLSLYNGSYYLYWAPFPAILLMPFIALFGVHFSDVTFTIFVALLNVGLIAQLLRVANQRAIIHLSPTQRSILVFFFAMGTVHVTQSPFGDVWGTGQIISFTCTILAYLTALTMRGAKAWFFTGLALTGAMLTRSQTVFTGIFPAVYLLYQEKSWNWKRVILHLMCAAIPMALGLLSYLYYNQARFGSPFETGIAYHLMDDFFRPDYNKYGMFNLHYIPINIFYEYLFYPFPITDKVLMGGSLFLLSPLFFAIFPAICKAKPRWVVWALLASILVTNIPIILLMGTGYASFGPRYTLDFIVPLLLLAAMGMEKWKNWICLVLSIIAFIHYFIGANLYRF